MVQKERITAKSRTSVNKSEHSLCSDALNPPTPFHAFCISVSHLVKQLNTSATFRSVRSIQFAFNGYRNATTALVHSM